MIPNSQPLGSESGKFTENMKIERSNADSRSLTQNSEGWEHESAIGKYIDKIKIYQISLIIVFLRHLGSL